MSTSVEELFKLDVQSSDSRPGQSPAGEAKRFREYDQSQQFLLPPSLDDWLAADDEARFISEIVDDVLDLGGIYASYQKLRGAPPYDPAIMLKILLYAYSQDSRYGAFIRAMSVRILGHYASTEMPKLFCLASFVCTRFRSIGKQSCIKLSHSSISNHCFHGVKVQVSPP